MIARREPIRSLSQQIIERGIRDIYSALGIGIDYSRIERGYFIPHDEDSTPDLGLILESFEVLTVMRQDTGVHDFTISERRRATDTEHLYGLVYAIRSGLCVAFDAAYLKTMPIHPSQRMVR